MVGFIVRKYRYIAFLEYKIQLIITFLYIPNRKTVIYSGIDVVVINIFV